MVAENQWIFKNIVANEFEQLLDYSSNQYESSIFFVHCFVDHSGSLSKKGRKFEKNEKNHLTATCAG